MQLIPNLGGYRLSMQPNQEFHVSKSIQVYKGIIAKIMVFLNLAFIKDFIDDNGQIISLAVNKKSLGHYIWRHNRCRDFELSSYTKNMKNLYKVPHCFFFEKYGDYRAYIKEISPHIDRRNLFREHSLRISEFFNTVHCQAPLQGHFFKIKQGTNTVGYLMGTTHAGNELFSNLNPKINKALRKTQIVAGEVEIDKMGERKHNPPENLKKRYKQFCHTLNKSMEKNRSSYEFGIEKCILSKIQSSNPSKELVGLETQEEQDAFFNLYIKEANLEEEEDQSNESFWDNNPVANEKAMLPTEESTNVSALIAIRNQNMVNRAEPYFERGRTFIAVGALHLYGEHGMRKLFADKGYTLTP